MARGSRPFTSLETAGLMEFWLLQPMCSMSANHMSSVTPTDDVFCKRTPWLLEIASPSFQLSSEFHFWDGFGSKLSFIWLSPLHQTAPFPDACYLRVSHQIWKHSSHAFTSIFINWRCCCRSGYIFTNNIIWKIFRCVFTPHRFCEIRLQWHQTQPVLCQDRKKKKSRSSSRSPGSWLLDLILDSYGSNLGQLRYDHMSMAS